MGALDLRLRAYRAAPGETVHGWVAVLQAVPNARSLEAFLRYENVTRDCHPAWEEQTGPLAERALQAGASFEFALQLPPDAAPGFESEHGKLGWFVDVKVDEAADLDTHARVELELAVE